MKSKLLAGASFAHLLGRSAAKPGADDKPKENEAENPEKKPEDGGGENAGRNAENGDPEPEDDDDEGDDESDDADMKKKGSRAARMRERARCAAIFADAAAGRNPALAAQLAFCTGMPRSEAVAVLQAGAPASAQPSGRRPSLDERMAHVRTPVAGPGSAKTGPQDPTAATAAAIIAADKKRRGEA